MRNRAVAAALALAGSVLVAAPAGAAPSQGEISLRVYNPTGTVTLSCGTGPTPDTHPYPKEACAEIEAAKGDIAAIPPLPGAGCTDEWDPVLVGVTGRWQGSEILFSDFESNPGCSRISHGHVFLY